MNIITLTNPTDIEGVQEYRELFWVPSIQEHRELFVWREMDGTFSYAFNDAYAGGFSTAQAAYEAGLPVALEYQ